ASLAGQPAVLILIKVARQGLRDHARNYFLSTEGKLMGTSDTLGKQPEVFNYGVVRQFAIMTVVWGIVGMAVGVWIAAQLIWPELNFDIPWLSYGRLRPLHTNAVIFAFGGS